MSETPERPKTPYAVLCHGICGQVFLTGAEYDLQMSDPDAVWRCPACGDSADFDDGQFEESMEH